MTTEEAIRILNPETMEAALDDIKHNDGTEAMKEACYEVCRMAISALRAQQGCENPKPLTLDELQEMIGEPVWIVYTSINIGHWGIVSGVLEDDGIHICTIEDTGDYATSALYGKTCMAYRHKPKEVL